MSLVVVPVCYVCHVCISVLCSDLLYYQSMLSGQSDHQCIEYHQCIFRMNYPHYYGI